MKWINCFQLFFGFAICCFSFIAGAKDPQCGSKYATIYGKSDCKEEPKVNTIEEQQKSLEKKYMQDLYGDNDNLNKYILNPNEDKDKDNSKTNEKAKTNFLKNRSKQKQKSNSYREQYQIKSKTKTEEADNKKQGVINYGY